MNRLGFECVVRGIPVALRLLREADNGVVNVLVHGYAGAEDEKALEAFSRHCRSLPEATTFLLHWDAGDLAAAAVRGAWSRISGAGAASLPVRGLSRAFGPVGGVLGWMADAVVGGAEGAWRLFKDVRVRADRLSDVLGEFLGKALAGRHMAALNLIGHSLGARILVRGAADAAFQALPLRDVVLMGAATPWPPGGVPLPQGARLFNLYSRSDGALRLTREDCIGQVGLPDVLLQNGNVRQVHCRGYGHTDYWPNLGDLSRIAGFLHEGESPWLGLAETLPMRDVQKRMHTFYVITDADEKPSRAPA